MGGPISWSVAPFDILKRTMIGPKPERPLLASCRIETPHRREFLKLVGAAAAAGPLAAQRMPMAPAPPPIDAKEISGIEFNLEIAPVTVELAPNRIISTVGYNGSSPGPLLRMKQGVPVTVNVVNKTD